jgi:glycogen debranching enzyme
MRRRSLLVATAATGALNFLPKGAQATAKAAQSFPVLDSLAMAVAPEENRQFSFTDKASAYFYGRTHQDKPDDWFFGWNVATKRIFQDYRLTLDGKPLLRAGAKVVVSPHAITRDYGTVKETLRLFDGLTALMVDVETSLSGQIGFEFTGDFLSVGEVRAEGVWHRPKEAPNSWLLLAPIEGGGQGYFILLGATKAEVRRLLSQLRRNHHSLTRARMARMEALVSGSRALDAGDPDRTKALLWMRLTADQLVMKQMGTGIYAGLPWFNDYWGRDTFISITGTLFVTGQYDVAADVFRSFAALQDTDPKSKTYGRIPNRARPDGVQYNTADGTPRFIITLADLVHRTGDLALARELSPTVKRAIEGMLAQDLDESGFVTHGDADTWMDAKEKGVRAFSPRGNRAIDIQALWIEALEAAIGLMFLNVGLLIGRREIDAKKAMAQSLTDHFVDKATGKLVDHLKPDGSPDLAVRPNAFFALDILEKNNPRIHTDEVAVQKQKMIWARDLWKGLVYPWGVATLSQDDPEFHPYHEHWHYYHKDAAYHNGTVWPWLNGVAMTTLLRFGVQKEPWQLFENMNRQALREGAVGSLAECADALPLPGATWARRTGTFLQAWSNAEHLRVWHEEILGVRIQGGGELVEINPQLPKSVLNVAMNTPLKKGVLKGQWHRGNAHTWVFELQGADAAITFSTDAAGPNWVTWLLKAGQRVEIIEEGSRLKLTAYDRQNRVLGNKISGLDVLVDGPTSSFEKAKKEQKAFETLRDEVFKDLGFCEPKLAPNLKSLSVYHDPPLTY